MGQPVVHVEVIGKDGGKLQSYYSELFGWEIDADNPMNYGAFQYEDNKGGDGRGVGGGIASAPDGSDGHVTFYVGVPDVEEALAKAEGLGGGRVFGPDVVMEGVEIGQFTDPEGHVIGLFKT